MRRLRGSLADRQDEVDRLRKVLRGRKLTPEQVGQLRSQDMRRDLTYLFRSTI